MTSSGLFRRLRNAIAPLAFVLLFAHAALGLSKASVPKPVACNASDPSFDDTSDIQNFSYYKAAIQRLFHEEKFAELDCIADAARVSKSRFAFGGWKLKAVYLAIAEPQGHATEEDWATHLKTLNRWVSTRPESITARVVLAEAYTEYAWNARGTGFSDTVSQSGWKLFEQRIDKAKEILEQASKLKSKCPQWYVVMQTVALAEGWNRSKATALLDQAVAFEPDYYYYYRQYANYLLPKWYGEEDDAEKFAEQAADHVGGGKGDILYFQIATHLICHCRDEPNLALMSWPRIQKGVAELEKQNGPSLTNLNLLAYMAIQESDGMVAHTLFLRIGSNWDNDTWRTMEYLDYSKKWATQHAAYQPDRGHLIIQQAKAKFAGVIHECAYQGGGDVTQFALILTLQKDGVVDSVSLQPETKVGLCLMKLKGETLWPPNAPFMFMIEVDPAELISLSAH
jgi:hypothetical protein